jgi:hypothetical protein
MAPAVVSMSPGRDDASGYAEWKLTGAQALHALDLMTARKPLRRDGVGTNAPTMNAPTSP